MFDLIGQFIAGSRLRREMRGEQFTGFLDAVDDTGSEFGIFEVAGHFFRQHLPKSVTALLMHRRVADDGKLARARRDKNQNTIAMLRFGHAQPVKLRLRRRDGIVHIFTADEDADFAGSFLFGGLDGGDDVVVPELVEKFAMFHITSSLPRRRRQSCRRHRKNHCRRHRHRRLTNCRHCYSHRWNNLRWKW